MKKRHLCILLASSGLAFGAAADEGSVTITAPANNARLDAMAQNRITYEVAPGPRGDHTHLYVDGKEVAVLRQLKASHALETLAPGTRELCIKVVNKNHTPIGIEKCIKVKVE